MLQLTPEQANSALAYAAYESMMAAINLAATQAKANQLADELGKTQAQRDEALKLITTQQGTIVAQQATIEAKSAQLDTICGYHELTPEQMVEACKLDSPVVAEAEGEGDPAAVPLPVLVDVVDEPETAPAL